LTEFYVTDRNFNLQTIISTNGNTRYHVSKAHETTTLSTSSKTLQIDVHFSKNDSLELSKQCAVGNYILYKDSQNKTSVMVIMKASHNPVTGIRSMELESGSLDLLNETTGAYDPKSQRTIAEYINYFIYDSGFEIGVNEIPNSKRSLSWEGNATTLERILSVATQFDVELEFRFELVGNNVTHWFIDIRKRVGADTSHKLYVDKDIHSITTETDLYQMYNASKAEGSVVDGQDKPLTLKGYKWTDPDGRFYLDHTTGIIHDKANITHWRRPGSNNGYYLQLKTYTANTQKALLESAIADLKKYSTPIVNYIVDVANVPFSLNIGDTLYLVDENEQLFLNSRVQIIEYDFLTKKTVLTLGDFVQVPSGISDIMRDWANEFNNKIKENVPYTVNITQSEPFFVNGEGTITLTATISQGSLDVTSSFHDFKWIRYKLDGTLDSDFTESGISITVTAGSELRYTYEVSATND
jgi:hypothetical protein